jgi:hypothetical protein
MFQELPDWLRGLLFYFAIALISLLGASAIMRAAFPNGLFGTLIDPETGQVDGVELIKNILTLAVGFMLLLTLLYERHFGPNRHDHEDPDP